jgi:hypothetical protein
MRQSIELPLGTYEEALGWVGRERSVQFAEVPVNWPMIKVFASLLEDPNPAYWDEDAGRFLWGGVVAPPAMLHAWLMPLQWRPQGAEVCTTLAAMVPLPGNTLINVSVETTYSGPIREGTHLNLTERIVSISPEKRSRLGRGHFITSAGIYRDQQGHELACHTNTLFRYSPSEEDVSGGDHAAVS